MGNRNEKPQAGLPLPQQTNGLSLPEIPRSLQLIQLEEQNENQKRAGCLCERTPLWPQSAHRPVSMASGTGDPHVLSQLHIPRQGDPGSWARGGQAAMGPCPAPSPHPCSCYSSAPPRGPLLPDQPPQVSAQGCSRAAGSVGG